jgi:hypothetical protein
MGHQPEPENRHPKNQGIRAIKIPKHDRRASCIGDGYLTVRDFKVPVSLGLKITEMQF